MLLLPTALLLMTGGCSTAVDGDTSADTGAQGAPLLVSVGEDFSCAWEEGEPAWCWGSSTEGRLDAPGEGARQLDCGSSYSYAVVEPDGDLVLWGELPTAYTTLGPGAYRSVSAGQLVACGVDSSGTLACAGNPDVEAVTGVPAGTSWEQASAGLGHACALSTSGEVRCWGDGPAARDPEVQGFVQVAAGRAHNCALREAGEVSCWGADQGGETEPPDELFQSVSAGSRASCGLTGAGAIRCWGAAGDHGLTSPPAGEFRSIDLSAVAEHGCAVSTDDRVVCWGRDDSGQADPPDPGSR